MTSKFSIDNKELLQRISSGEAVVGIDFGNLIVRELAAFRMAAMDSEPVIIVGDDGGDALAYRRLIQSFAPGTKLYRHAQPAPVVPELRVDWQENEFSAGWNACRAAMLAAAPNDTPALSSVQSAVTVPGKWIPVSERMPEVGVKVLCFPAEDEPIHAVFNGQLWLQDVSWSNSDEPIDNVITCNVTHWVPLPASPQEVK
ncbi:DUF551 domain-containing protein [Klebsiella pneumoniae]